MKVFVTYVQKSTRVTEHRATIMDMLMSEAGYKDLKEFQPYSKNFFNTRTFIAEPQPFNIQPLIDKLDTEFTKEYIEFRIPKASGGTRLIKAPEGQLKELQREVVDVIQDRFKVLPHNAAYAYTRGRCAYDAMVTHQRANARWFLKIDIKDFFPSITDEVLFENLPYVYPLNELTHEQLVKLIDIATDEGSLPQGSPLSPLLSNLILVEFDKILTERLRRFEKQNYTYTRYADDLLISCPYTFKFDSILEVIRNLFEELDLPFTLAPQKIRYASKAGRNWNLGLMYNQDQNITVGTKRKRELHSLVNSFCTDDLWGLTPTQELIGKLGYLKNVEPDYYDSLINKYETKYNVNILSMFKTILNN